MHEVMKQCEHCLEWYIHAHYCRFRPLTQKVPWIPGTVSTKNLTEEDVRRIVREELAKLTPNAEIKRGAKE